MDQAYRHWFGRGAEAANEFDRETLRFELGLDFLVWDIVWNAFENDLKGAFLRETESVEFSFGRNKNSLNSPKQSDVGGSNSNLVIGSGLCREKGRFKIWERVYLRCDLAPGVRVQ